MRPTPSSIAITLLCAALSACGGGEDPAGPDPGAGDDADAGASDAGGDPDAPGASVRCTTTRQLAAYPWGLPGGTYFGTGQNAPPNDVTVGVFADDWAAPRSRLALEVWFGAVPGGLAVPATRAFRPGDRYFSCDVCLTLAEGCSGGACRTSFFAQGGSLTLTRADRNASVGGVAATGTDLLLVEWSLADDRPVEDGRCIALQRLDMDIAWGESGECSGSFCSQGQSGGGCCAGSPFCTNTTGSQTRFCSSLCGGSGDGCGSAGDCCDGFRCFLGTCISDSCAGDTCTTGMDGGGGCCAAAPYCTTGAACRAVCGEAGVSCGSSGDCCTGLSCQGGTCG